MSVDRHACSALDGPQFCCGARGVFLKWDMQPPVAAKSPRENTRSRSKRQCFVRGAFCGGNNHLPLDYFCTPVVEPRKYSLRVNKQTTQVLVSLSTFSSAACFSWGTCP